MSFDQGPKQERESRSIDLRKFRIFFDFQIARLQEQSGKVTDERMKKRFTDEALKWRNKKMLFDRFFSGAGLMDAKSIQAILLKQEESLGIQIADPKYSAFHDRYIEESHLCHELYDLASTMESSAPNKAFDTWVENRDREVAEKRAAEQANRSAVLQQNNNRAEQKSFLEAEKVREEMELLEDFTRESRGRFQSSIPPLQEVGNSTAGFQSRIENCFQESDRSWAIGTFGNLARMETGSSIRRDPKGFGDMRHLEAQAEQDGTHEFCLFQEAAPVISYTTKEEEVIEPGLFFNKKRKVQKSVETGRQVRKMKDVDPHSTSNEEAVDFLYTAMTAGGDRGYRDYSGRDGNYLLIHVSLPRSLAERLSKKISEDPLFARKLVEKYVLEKVKIPEEFWKKGVVEGDSEQQRPVPLRPPFEEWTAQFGGPTKMAFQNGLESGSRVQVVDMKEKK